MFEVGGHVYVPWLAEVVAGDEPDGKRSTPRRGRSSSRRDPERPGARGRRAYDAARNPSARAPLPTTRSTAVGDRCGPSARMTTTPATSSGRASKPQRRRTRPAAPLGARDEADGNPCSTVSLGSSSSYAPGRRRSRRPEPASRSSTRAEGVAAWGAEARRLARAEHDRGDPHLALGYGDARDDDRLCGSLVGAAERADSLDRVDTWLTSPTIAYSAGSPTSSPVTTKNWLPDVPGASTAVFAIAMTPLTYFEPAGGATVLYPGPPLPVWVGSPPWMTKSGTMRWKIVSSKKPSRASATSDAAVSGARSVSRSTVNDPQLVSRTRAP